jgi:hypothetical protein
MKKYKITGIPKFSNGGGPGDKYYKDNNNNQFKKNAQGEWLVWNPASSSWNYTDRGYYQGMDLNNYESGFIRNDANWTSDKPKTPKPAITLAPTNTTVLTSKLPSEKKPFKAPKSNTFTSETVQKVASKTVPQTDQQWNDVMQAEVMYDNKRHYLSQDALAKNYDDIAYRVAQDIQSKNPKLSFEEALEQAKNNSKLLNEKAYEYVSQDPALVSRLAEQKGYSQPTKDDSVKELDLNDPNHVELSGRMPETVGEYFQRGADILFNPLDAIHYGMSPTEEMPINMYEYEKAKQQLGYEDGADRNAVNEGIDFASWFTGAGQVAQGIKMLRGTGESLYNFAKDPSWESAGNAAMNTVFNAMALNPVTRFASGIGGKSTFINPATKYAGYAKFPGNTEVMYGNPYLQDAKAIVNLPGFKLAKGKAPKGGVPALRPGVPAIYNPNAFNTATTALGLAENAGNSLLSTVSQPHVITESPLTTITPAIPKKQPFDLDAALAADEAGAFPGTSDIYKYDIEKNKNVGEILDQIKNDRVELLTTREGKARVEALIAENPHMQNLTYDDVVEGMRNIINDNAVLTSVENEIYTVSNELDRLSQAPYLYAEEIQVLQDKLDDLNSEATILETKIQTKGSNAALHINRANSANQTGSIKNIKNIDFNKAIEKDMAMASPEDKFTMFAGLNLSNADLRRIGGHEIVHYLQRGKSTNLDKELSKLKLRLNNNDVDNNLFAGESGVSEFWKRVMDIDRAGGTPFEKMKKYWKTGGKGQEKLAHVDEIRSDMLERGIMKEFYEEVTPEMLEKHYKQYMSEVGNKYPLRVYELMENEKGNFDLLSGVINRMPSVVGAGAVAADYLTSEDSDVSQAGVLGALAMFTKKPGRLPVKALNVGKQILKKGYNGLTATGKKIANQFFKPEVKETFAKPEILRAPEKVKEAWKAAELPGLHLKSTMADGPISKIVEPKTGLVNVEQALAIIGKESGGSDKVALIKQALGDVIPKKMDYNDFRKVVQDKLIPLEKRIVNHRSSYGIDRLGYNTNYYNMALKDIPKKEYIPAIEKELTKRGIEYNEITEIKDMGNNINVTTKRPPDGFEFTTIIGKGHLKPFAQRASMPLENETLILGNKYKFGRGSNAHGNPEETLGHIHFFRDSKTPDILTVTQIQSDAFQGTHRIMPDQYDEQLALRGLESMERRALQQEEDWANAVQQPDGSWKYPGEETLIDDYLHRQGPGGQRDMNKMRRGEIENFSQKKLLDKNHQERYLQELVSYAAERGDVNKIRIPTSETAAKVQNYKKGNSNDYYDRDITENLYTQRMADIIDAYGMNSPEFNEFNQEYMDALKHIKNIEKENYSSEEQTILKKYKEYPKMIKKVFGTDVETVIDNKGNTWYELDIPKSFKEGKGEIKALGIIPYIAAGAAGADLILNDDTDNSTSQAGMLGLLGAFAKKPGSILPKEAIKAGKKLMEKGYNALKPETQSVINRFFSKDVQYMTPDEFNILHNESQYSPRTNSQNKQGEFKTVDTPKGTKPYVKALDIPDLKYDTATKSMQLTDAKQISTKEYVDIFNQNLDKLNEIIEQKNKSGIKYRVTGLTESGTLKFETLPDQGVKPGTQVWRVNINPALWNGQVKDIMNKEYFKAVPGLEMSSSTSSVFNDGQARRGTNTYAAINEYLKSLDLGRVKPGFNFQTNSAEQTWKSYIKADKAYGYYGDQDAYDEFGSSEIYGVFKRKGGPIDNSMEIEIPEKDIQKYIDAGYIVEQLDKPKMQQGGVPSEVWYQYTGTPWSEAKSKGLTDGTVEQNLALVERLKAGEFGSPKIIETKATPTVTPYDQMVFGLVKQGNTLDDLVNQKVGTREGLIFKYPELFANKKNISAPKKPGKKPGKGTTIMEQFDALSKFISPYADEIGDAVSTAYDSWITRQSKIAEQEKKAKKKPAAPSIDLNKIFTNKIEEYKKFGKPIVEQKPVVQQKQVIQPYDIEALRAQLTQSNMAGVPPSLTKQQPQQPFGNNTAAQFQQYGIPGKGIENTSLNLQPDPEVSLWDVMSKVNKDLSSKTTVEEKPPVFDNSISSQLIEQEWLGRQQKDNERYGKFMSKGIDIVNRTDVQRNVDSEKFFADIAKPNSVIIDIGSALGNSDPKLAGVSVWELTQNPKIKQKKIKVIATDIPEQVSTFKKHAKDKKAYNIDYAEVPMTYNTPIDTILKTKNLSNTKDVYLRAANSIDLLMTVAQTKEHFYNIAKKLKAKNVTYVYNNMIWYKPSGETSWRKLGNINNAAYDHNAASWKLDKNRKPYALTGDDVRNPFNN